MSDIRLCVNFFTHKKRRRLQKLLGKQGVMCLIDLWLNVSHQRSSGVLTGFDEMDIELCADWDGEDGVFVDALLDTGFLDKDVNGVYCFHNWEERQGWVVQADDRKDKARFSRVAHLYPNVFKQLKEAGINKITPKEYAKIKNLVSHKNDVLTDVDECFNKPLSPTPAPTPAPTPIVNKKEKQEKEKLERSQEKPSAALPSNDGFVGSNKNKKPKTPKKKPTQAEGLKRKLAGYLSQGITNNDLNDHRSKIEEFFKWRMSLKADKRYKSEKGIDGLIRDILACRGQEWDLERCLDYTMQREWLTPQVSYFRNVDEFQVGGISPDNRLAGMSKRSQQNYQQCQEFINAS